MSICDYWSWMYSGPWIDGKRGKGYLLFTPIFCLLFCESVNGPIPLFVLCCCMFSTTPPATSTEIFKSPASFLVFSLSSLTLLCALHGHFFFCKALSNKNEVKKRHGQMKYILVAIVFALCLYPKHDAAPETGFVNG